MFGSGAAVILEELSYFDVSQLLPDGIKISLIIWIFWDNVKYTIRKPEVQLVRRNKDLNNDRQKALNKGIKQVPNIKSSTTSKLLIIFRILTSAERKTISGK